MSTTLKTTVAAVAGLIVGTFIGLYFGDTAELYECGFVPEAEEMSFWPQGTAPEELDSITVQSDCNRWAAGSLEEWIEVTEPDFSFGPGDYDPGAHGEAPVKFAVQPNCSGADESGAVTKYLDCGLPREGEIMLFQTLGFHVEPGRGSIAIHQRGLSAPPQISGECYLKSDGLYYALTWPELARHEDGLESVLIPWMKIGDGDWTARPGIPLAARETGEAIEGAPLWPIRFRVSLGTLSEGTLPQYHSAFSNTVSCQEI